MVKIRALDFEECALECGNTANHSVFYKVIDMVIFSHVPRVRRGNEPLEEAGRGLATFVDIGIPDPESAVPFKLRIGCEAEKTSLIISLWNRIAQPGKARNVASESSYFRAKVEKNLRRAVRR